MARMARSVPATIKRFPLSFAVAFILPPIELPSIERTALSVADVINLLALPLRVFLMFPEPRRL